MNDTLAFNIQFTHNGIEHTAIIHPCCNENNIVAYAVWQDGKLVFTITRDMVDKHHWSIALKNADDHFDDSMIQKIGGAIEKHEMNYAGY